MDVYDEIITNLFIGGGGAAKNCYGFSMIVNCTRKSDISFPTECKNCIRIGVGNGSICTTRLETGIGKGQFSAVSECFKYKSNYIYNHIIFVDDKYIDIISNFCNSDKIIIPINTKWLKENCTSWKKLEVLSIII